MSNKIIFLDNDGVICLSNNWGGRKKKYAEYLKTAPYTPINLCPVDIRFDDFDVKAIKTLNSVLEKTGADIVVSSDWRNHATLEELGEYYLSQGIIKKPIGVTSRVDKVDPIWWNKFRGLAYLEHERVIEIKYWLSQHPEVINWVEVDDLNLGIYEPHSGDIFNENGLTNFVHTTKENEGIKQTGIEEKIIKYFNDKTNSL